MKNPLLALYLTFLVAGLAWALLSFGPYVPHEAGRFRACSTDHGVAFVDSDRYTFVINHHSCPDIRAETPLTITHRFSDDRLCAGTQCFVLAKHRTFGSLW